MLDWLGLVPPGQGCDYELPLVPRLCAPRGPLFGGAALAAMIAAAEHASGRTVVAAHVQLVRASLAPGRLRIALEAHATSRSVSHLHLRGRLDDTLTAQALVSSVDRAPEPETLRRDTPPVVAPADACPQREYADPDPASINGALDVRVAREAPENEGSCLLWARTRDPVVMCAASLALLADHVPYAARRALGGAQTVVSLDNALRIFSVSPQEVASEWVLLDLSLRAVAGGVGHGRVALWSEAGIPLAEGTQTFRVL
jgi:acyl-CoA thioesterase